MAEANNDQDAFNWLGICAPCFKINGDNIDVIYSPNEFYESLLHGSKTAKHRVVLAALYLGTDECEQALVESLLESLKIENRELNVDILLDYVRGSRGENNSRTMLLPLLKENPSKVNVSLYHTPMLRGLLKKMLPNRWNETIGVAHLKVFIFDDTLILSGANLSNDYFKNRQDRYMAFKNCKELCDYFHDLVKTVSKFSFQLKSDDSVTLAKDWNQHPYKGNLEEFVSEAHSEIKDLVTDAMKNNEQEIANTELFNKCWEMNRNNGFFSSMLKKSQKVCAAIYNAMANNYKESVTGTEYHQTNNLLHNTKSSKIHKTERDLDTWIYPAIQMGNLGVCQDQVITETLMKSFPMESKIAFTSGYFNVTDDYCNLLLKTAPEYNILLASPEANGFLGARGFAGYIPAVYVYLARQFFNRADKIGRLDQLALWEYVRPGWTFHGKGLWCYLPNESLPSLTLIGSPNFGSRSVTRDLEAQAVIFTSNNNLKQKLHKEQQNLSKFSTRITHDTFKQERYNVPRWVIFVTQLIRRYF